MIAELPPCIRAQRLKVRAEAFPGRNGAALEAA
jgi:hypothetical protein